MTQPVDIQLDLGGNYTDSIDQATSATQVLQGAVSGLQASSSGMQRVLGAITPSRVHIAAWTGFTAAAARYQQEMSGVAATAEASGQSLSKLSGDVQHLARQFPIGTQGAIALVQAVQGLGASQSRILPLAQTFQRIAGATNSFGPDMAMSFGQLNREMASLDPSRVARFGDVLTTLSAKSGASAMGMVSFAHSIAPMAQQAGIGETSVLGISSAFVKLGDDGGAAATAVNKILSDLNRSVREGSNDMAAYAQITGMTVSQFKALYQNDPTKALTSVTNAIGRAGPRGQMELESLGLEGVRTQRALLQLSQSGGLSQAISQAQGAYGSGSTNKAAAAAFGDLNDSLTELRSTAGQTADALGGPFLHALTKIVDVSKTLLAPVNAVLGSSYGQHLIGGAGAVAITGLLARRLVGPMSALAIGRQVATSGPLRSLAGGYAFRRTGGDIEAALGTRAGAFGQESLAMQAYGAPYGRGFMQGVNRFSSGVGGTIGEAVGTIRGAYVPGQGGGPGLIGAARRAGRAGIAAASLGYEAYANTYADPFVQSQLPAGERRSLLTPVSGGLFDRAGTARTLAMNQAGAAGAGFLGRQYAGAQAGLGLLERQAGGTTGALARMSEASLGAARATMRFTGGLIEAGVGLGARASRGALNMVGGPAGAALIGGTALYGLYKSQQDQTNTTNATMRATDIYGVENSWRDSVGAASQAATSMADAMSAATDTINASVRNFPAATTVSSADYTAAGKVDVKSAHKNAVLPFVGSDADITSMIQASSLGGATPQDLQGAKIEMIRQGIPAERINRILAGVQPGGTGGQLTPQTLTGIAQSYSAAAHNYDVAGHGWKDTDIFAGKDAQKVAQAAAGSFGQQEALLAEKYGPQYATQRTVRGIDQLLKQMPKNRRYTFSHDLAATLGYTGSGGFFSAADMLGAKGVSIGGMSGADLTKLLTGPSLTAHLQPSIMEAPLRSSGASSLLPFFTSSTAKAPFLAGQQSVEYMSAGHEADVGAQTAATNEIVNAATKAGTSLTDLAVQATKSTSATADWQQALLASIAAEAQFRQSVGLQGATRATTLSTKVGSDLKFIQAGPGVDPNGFQAKQYAQAKQDLADQRGSLVSYLQQRVMAQYQYQIQSARAQDDYQRQVTRSTEDFQRQTSRSEADFYRQRSRAVRDYNIQLVRQQQDAAKQMYDPYQRIQTEQVWDAPNLLDNSREQLNAMRTQIANIRELRNLGLSDATIEQLSLYDPNKAQQTAEMVTDLKANRTLARQFNLVTAQRTAAAGVLLSTSPESKRQRADFQRSLKDQQSDFNLAQKRSHEDFTLQMSRTQQDFNTQMARMAQDMHTQDLEITNNLTALTKDMNKIVSGQFVDVHGQVTNSLAGMLADAKKYVPKINAALSGIDTSGGGANTQENPALGYTGTHGRQWTGSPETASNAPTHRIGSGVNKGFLVTGASKPGTGMNTYGNPNLHWGVNVAVAPDNRRLKPNAKLAQELASHYGWNGGVEWAALYQIWNQESGFSPTAGSVNAAYGIPQADPGTKMASAGRDWRTNPRTQIDWGLDYIWRAYGDPLGAWAHKSRTGWYGEGGIATSPHLGVVAERGVSEAMIPLDARGMKVLAGAMKQYIGVDDLAKLSTGGMATAIHIDNSKHYYDHRNDFTGAHFEVRADDPMAFAREGQALAKRNALTQPRGVAWSPST